ncbi:hypothetical protein [Carnobacterium maltaromaticum]|uniref:hypothetical protein n=1 Tax=Carnobacterium maltaromaticum TaxID=2751 RepID=UPI0039BEBE01
MRKFLIPSLISILILLSIVRIVHVNKNNDLYKVSEHLFLKEDKIKFNQISFKIKKIDPSFEQYSEENEANMIYTPVFVDVTNIGNSTINVDNTMTIYENYKNFTNLTSWTVTNAEKELAPGETSEILIQVEFGKGAFWGYYEDYQIGKNFSLLIVDKNQTKGVQVYKTQLPN